MSRNGIFRKGLAPAVACLLFAVAACGAVKNVLALSQSLQDRYHVPVSVNVRNGGHLALTFQNAPGLDKMDSTAIAAFARDAASFAKSHYAGASDLRDIAVDFANVNETGPVTVKIQTNAFTFQASDLP